MSAEPGEWTRTVHVPLATDPLSLNKRLHWATVAKLTKQWRTFSALTSKRFPKSERIEVTLVWLVKDKRRRDVDNMFRLMKALADGIVDSGVVPDDVHRYMDKACRIEPAPAGSVTAYMELRVTGWAA